jgi:hypothetical protein
LNELLFGITLSFSQEVRPVMAPLAGLQGSYGTAGRPSSSPWLLVSLPAVIIFLAFQRSSSPPANQHRTQNRQQHLPAHPRRARVAIYTKVHDRLLPPLTAADRPPAPVELRKP